MPQKHIASNATIADVKSTLSKPEDYVCRVLSKLLQMQKVHGAVIVRIGVTGKGKMPHFRIDNAAGDPIQAFDYLGEPFPDYNPAETDDWSTQPMTLEEVEKVLGEIRSVRP